MHVENIEYGTHQNREEKMSYLVSNYVSNELYVTKVLQLNYIAHTASFRQGLYFILVVTKFCISERFVHRHYI